MQCSVRTKSVLWEEELHNDGSASAVLLGLTLYACRSVRFLQEPVHCTTAKEFTEEAGPDVVLSCVPGHVYVAGATGARHQVRHDSPASEDTWDSSQGFASLTIIMRSCVFPDRARFKNMTPAPRNVWETLASCVRILLSSPGFRLPSLQECSDQLPAPL